MIPALGKRSLTAIGGDKPSVRPKPVAIYVRVSTREQAEHGYSLQAQVDELRRYCERNNLHAVRIYQDRGVSGTTLDRPRLQKMLDQIQYQTQDGIQRGRFEAVLLWKFDRLSRKTRDFLELAEFLKMNNIGLISMTEALDASTSHGMCMLTVSISIAQMERENIIERSKLGLMARARTGKWRGGPVPYGYHYNKGAGFLEIYEEEAKVVRMIFQEYRRLKSMTQVKNWLNSKGYLRSGRPWYCMEIKRILEKPLYYGLYRYSTLEQMIESYRIIDKELFDNIKILRLERQPSLV